MEDRPSFIYIYIKCMYVLDALINSRTVKRGIWRLDGAGGLDRAACWRCFLKPAHGERRAQPRYEP